MDVFCFKIFITIFFQNLFSHSRSRIFTRIEWWYSQAPNRPREEDTDDFRFLTFRSGKTPALSRLTSDFPDFRNLSISRQPLSNINKHQSLFFPPNHSPPIVIDSRPDFAYDTSPIAGRSHQSFSSSGACGTCVSYDMHLRKLFTPLPHKYFVPHVFSPTLPPPR